MKLLILTALLISTTASAAFLKHSYVSGMSRFCVYDSAGGDLVITVKSYQLCPLSI